MMRGRQLNNEELEVLLESYRQASEYVRAYMDLRFKHFTSFLVVVGVLGGGLTQLSSSSLQSIVSVVGAAVTVLFWLLDSRTGAYYAAWWSRVAECETALAASSPNLSLRFERPKSRGPSAVHVTNTLFLIFFLMWIGFAVFHMSNLVTAGNR